jgi:uncharacterized protein DUF6599
MFRKWFWGLLGVMALATALQGQSRESVLKAVAQDSGWSPADKPTQYDEKNIEALAGRRAASIIHYGLIGATTQAWRGSDGSVRVTLYEMLDASAAYGFFTLERNIEQPGYAMLPVGTEGFRIGNRSTFWHAQYVVKLEGNAAAADRLAKLISDNIFGRSRKPPVSRHLPPEDLVQGSERYVLDESGISRKADLDPKTVGFDDGVEIATADYRVSGKTAQLVLLMYPTQQIAKKYAEEWDVKAPNDSALRKRVGPLLALVRGTKDGSVAASILDSVNYESQVTWNEPRPDIALREVILTIFSFIGVALLFTVVAGLSFGGLRVFVKARYPDRVFDRADQMEIIQLKLAQGVIRKELHE